MPNYHFYGAIYGIMAVAAMADFATAANLRRKLQKEPSFELLDLSKPFVLHPRYNNNTCAGKLIELASNEPEIRGMVVLEHGQIVTEYYKGGEDQTTRAPLWSCTKAFTNLLLGVLVKDGILSLNETLADVFAYDPYDWIWGNVEDAEDRKTLTIESIITMTAGLSLPDDWLTDALLGAFDYGSFGGKDLIDSLNYHKLDPSRTGNEFEYVLAGNLLSYIIKERSRLTPDEFAKTQVFPLMGIGEEDYIWHSNRDGISYSWHGLFMTVRAMAKLGMLYLQQGHPNGNDDTIVDESFVHDSARGTFINPRYGYGLWNTERVYPPDRPTRYFAGGLGQQTIFVDENLGRVMAITANNYIPFLAGGEVDNSVEVLALMVGNPNCTFSKTS